MEFSFDGTTISGVVGSNLHVSAVPLVNQSLSASDQRTAPTT
jgi:hypothetical protein